MSGESKYVTKCVMCVRYVLWITVSIGKSYMWTADRRSKYESDYRNNEHYFSSEKKAWKKIRAFTGVELVTIAIPVERSTK